MPLEPLVADAFISAYLHLNHAPVNSTSFFSTTLDVVKKITHTAVRKMAVEEKIAHCHRFKNQLKAELSFNDWIEIIIDLGNAAAKQQSDILVLPGHQAHHSQLAMTLHAIRSYIMTELKLGKHSEHYLTHLKKLNEQLQEKDAAIQSRQLHYRDVQTLTDERKRLLLDLAYLEDPHAKIRCIDYGFFHELPTLNNHPANLPYCLQENFYLIFFKEHLQEKLNMSFETFITKAICGSHRFIIVPQPTAFQALDYADSHSDSEPLESSGLLT